MRTEISEIKTRKLTEKKILKPTKVSYSRSKTKLTNL